MGVTCREARFVPDASEEEVIQFGLRFKLQKDLPADEIAVCASDVNTFCGDQFLEGR